MADLTYLHIKAKYEDIELKVTTFGQPRGLFTGTGSNAAAIADELLWEGDSKTAYVQGKVKQSSDVAYYVSILGTSRIGTFTTYPSIHCYCTYCCYSHLG